MTNNQLATLTLWALVALAVGVTVNRFKNNTPRGIKNNNPLNIRKSAISWQGKTGDDGTFEVFDTPHNGIRAAARNLKTYANSHGLRTPRAIIGRWAPAVENNVEAYVSSVVKRSGLFADLILEPNDYVKLVEAMIYHENGQQPYDTALIRKAVQDGFA